MSRALAHGQGTNAPVTPAPTDVFNTSITNQTNGKPTGLMTSSRAPKRSLPSDSPPRSTQPTQSFLPVASGPKSTASPALTALTAFLNAKKDGHMSKEDLDVLRVLHNNIEAENAGQREGEVHTPNKAEMRLGGWSAGTPRETPRFTKSMPGLGDSTPLNTSVYNTPGSAFSVGTSTPLKGTPNKSNPYQVRYLGPGMSPRRMLGKATSSSGIKPLFQFSVPAQDESVTKKRRVDGSGTLDVEVVSTPSKALPSTRSMPNLAASTASPAKTDKGKPRGAPHPLSQSISSTPPRDPVAVGKRRAADIMLSLIEEQTAPIKAAQANGAHTSDIIINPYDITTPQSATPSTPASKGSYESPRKSILRSSVRETPMRGAAAKLEANRGRTLTTLERASGVKSWDAPSPRKVKLDLPAAEKEQDEVDDMFDAAPTPVEEPTSPAEPKRKAIPAPEPFKAPEVPVLDTPARLAPVKKTSFTFQSGTDSPSRDAAFASFSKQEPPAKAPTFNFASATSNETPKDTTMSSYVNETTAIASSAKKTNQFVATKAFLSSKDTALNIDKAALPFYTFTVKSMTKDESQSTKAAKALALKAIPPTFDFSLVAAPASSAPVSSELDKAWDCDLCMLKNPATAKEKCQICEAPRPGAKASAPAAPAAPAAPTPAPADLNSDWSCSLCMLNNPGTAKEKCQICEAPRPKSVASAPKPAISAFQWGAAAPKQNNSEWVCSTCMCRSPLDAQKCVVCESPR